MQHIVHVNIPEYLPRFEKENHSVSAPVQTQASLTDALFGLVGRTGTPTALQGNVHTSCGAPYSEVENTEVTGFSLLHQNEDLYLVKEGKAYEVPANWQLFFNRHPVTLQTPMKWVQIRRDTKPGEGEYALARMSEGFLPVSALEEILQTVDVQHHGAYEMKVVDATASPILDYRLPAKVPTIYLESIDNMYFDSSFFQLNFLYHASKVLMLDSYMVRFSLRYHHLTGACEFVSMRAHTSTYTLHYLEQLEQIAIATELPEIHATALWPESQYPAAFSKAAQLPSVACLLRQLNEIVASNETRHLFEKSIQIPEWAPNTQKIQVARLELLKHDDESFKALCYEAYRYFEEGCDYAARTHLNTPSGTAVNRSTSTEYRIGSSLNKLTVELWQGAPLGAGTLTLSSGELSDGRYYVVGSLATAIGIGLEWAGNKFSFYKMNDYRFQKSLCSVLIIQDSLEKCAQRLSTFLRKEIGTFTGIRMYSKAGHEFQTYPDSYGNNIRIASKTCSANVAAQLKQFLQ